MMAAEVRVDVYHFAPRCLLGLFDAEAERWGIELRGLSRDDLNVLIACSSFEIPTAEHLRLHQEASDFVRWGRCGGLRTLALYGRAVLLAARPLPLVAHRSRSPDRAPC